jgi:hypothetical protein
MSDDYPMNMRPLDADAIRVLSNAGSLALYLAACDRPIPQADLARATGRPYDAALRRAEALMSVGLLRLENGVYVAEVRHVREEDLDEPGKTAFRMGILASAIGAVEDAKRAFRLRPQSAKAGIAMITLPDRPDVTARAVAILAEAEDQLRALAEETPPNGQRTRVVFFTHTMPPESNYFPNTPQ